MSNRFSDVQIELSDDEKTWLQELYKRSSKGEQVNPITLRIELHDQVSTDFQSSSIDRRLYDSGNSASSVGLTFLGTWLVDYNSRRVCLAEAVINHVRAKLIDGATEPPFEFSAQEVAKVLQSDLSPSPQEVATTFADLKEIGHFWSGATTGNNRNSPNKTYESIRVDHEEVVVEYLTFADIDTHVIERTRHWEEGGILPQRRIRGRGPGSLSKHSDYIAIERIAELDDIESDEFDLERLICLCEEINYAHQGQCHHAVIMLTRAIIDHVPPVFGAENFNEVANNRSGSARSFRDAMQQLNNVSRKIADGHLHLQVRRSEVLPTSQQVDFAGALDVLLAEIVRRLR